RRVLFRSAPVQPRRGPNTPTAASGPRAPEPAPVDTHVSCYVVREAGDRILGQLKRAFYARMEEVSFRSGAAVAGGVLTAAGVAITLAVVLGGHSDAAASAPASRGAVPSVAPPSPVPVSSSSPPTPRPSRTTDPAAVAGAYQPPSADRASATRH